MCFLFQEAGAEQKGCCGAECRVWNVERSGFLKLYCLKKTVIGVVDSIIGVVDYKANAADCAIGAADYSFPQADVEYAKGCVREYVPTVGGWFIRRI